MISKNLKGMQPTKIQALIRLLLQMPKNNKKGFSNGKALSGLEKKKVLLTHKLILLEFSKERLGIPKMKKQTFHKTKSKDNMKKKINKTIIE